MTIIYKDGDTENVYVSDRNEASQKAIAEFKWEDTQKIYISQKGARSIILNNLDDAYLLEEEVKSDIK